jgi:hypothetical protein
MKLEKGNRPICGLYMWVNYLPIFMPNSKLEVNPQKEFCFNPNCRDYGKRDAGNIVKFASKNRALWIGLKLNPMKVKSEAVQILLSLLGFTHTFRFVRREWARQPRRRRCRCWLQVFTYCYIF